MNLDQYTELYRAWVEQIAKRDMFYLYIGAIVLTAFIWYKGWPGKFFRLVVFLAMIAVFVGLVWGYTQL